MIRHSITLPEIVDFFNEIYVADPKAVRALLLAAFACNRKLAAHPRMVITHVNRKPAIGMMAILNSLFGVDEEGIGPLSVVENGRTLRFSHTRIFEQPEQYAKKREDERLKGEENALPYSVDEERVVKYLGEAIPEIGAGADPIGFLIASHAALSTMARATVRP